MVIRTDKENPEQSGFFIFRGKVRMRNGITLRFEGGKNKHTGEKWFYDTIFTYDDEKQAIDLSDGDCDSSAGDLEEWCFVKYKDIPAVIKLFGSLFGNFNGGFTAEQQKFHDGIENPDVREVFPYMLEYCTKHGGSMDSFMNLLKENGIEYEYSAYRSSGL